MADENHKTEDMDEEYETQSEEEMEEEPEQEPVELTAEQKAELAEGKKNEGNEEYKSKNYTKALHLYSEAIDLCPSCAAYYGNRAATFMMLSRFDKALEDSRQSISIDPNFVKGHVREAKCHVAMGEAAAAINSFEKALAIEPNNKMAKTEINGARTLQRFHESSENSYAKKDFRRVVFEMDQCLKISPNCRKFKIRKAECLALIKRYQEAQEIANDILRIESLNADAWYVRGLCLYYQDNVEKAFQHFQQVLKLAPDHKTARNIYKMAKALKSKKEEGNTAFRCGKLQGAYDIYTEALAIDPLNVYTNSKLYNNRAAVSSKLKKNEEAVEDCNRAIELDDTYVKAYMRRGKCFMDLEQYDEAVRDYEKIFKMEKSAETQRLLKDAKLELKKSKRKDYYKIMGVGKNCTEDEIKKAYKKRALLHHPDRHASATDAEKKEHEKKFKEIGEAYGVLSDAKKKSRYDSGHDLEDLDGGGGMGGHFDPNLIFQSFFGGQGGGYQFGHGPPGGHGHGHHAHPGGFQFQFG